MTLENQFNLIDEPWIPVIDKGRLSLRQIFSDASNRGLGGNPLQKMAMTKLLLAPLNWQLGTPESPFLAVIWAF